MTNKEFQRLGKVSRVIGVYVLDDLGERIRRLPEGSEQHCKYKPEELEIVMKKPYDRKNIFIDTDSCLF